MSASLLCGFESGHLNGDARDATGTCSIQTSVVRSGRYALRSNPSNSNGYVSFFRTDSGGAGVSFSCSIRFWINVASLPNLSATIVQVSQNIILTNTGQLSCAGSTSTKTLSADGLWHMVEAYSSGGTLYVDCDGVNWLTASATLSVALLMNIGVISSNTTTDLYFDDVLVSNTEDLPFRGSSKQVILLPTSDPGALNSWTNGGGGTTSIFEGVNNLPPVGAAASTDGIKVKNATSGGNLDYTPTMQTYIAAGVPVGSKINAVMAICNDGEEAATGAKVGSVWVASNPAQAAAGISFDYGDDSGVLGTFPTNWRPHRGPVATFPSVTLTTAPTMTIRKTTSTNRVVDVDFMGIYVDYTPAQPLTGSSAPIANAFPQLVRA